MEFLKTYKIIIDFLKNIYCFSHRTKEFRACAFQNPIPNIDDVGRNLKIEEALKKWKIRSYRLRRKRRFSIPPNQNSGKGIDLV